MVLLHKIKRSELKAGDHIYTYRVAFAYAHHGVYIGGNKVIHFTSANGHKKSIPRSSMCASLGDCGFSQPESLVQCDCLDCFLGNGALRRFEYGVSKAMFLAKVRGGCCTTAMSDEPDIVIHRANYLLHNGFGNYSLFKNNCEDFSLYCKTGLKVVDPTLPGSSGQILNFTANAHNVFFAFGLAMVLVPTILSPLPLTLPLITATAMTSMRSGGYFQFRLLSDIGVRKDAVKVRVEDLDDTMCAEGSRASPANHTAQNFNPLRFRHHSPPFRHHPPPFRHHRSPVPHHPSLFPHH